MPYTRAQKQKQEKENTPNKGPTYPAVISDQVKNSDQAKNKQEKSSNRIVLKTKSPPTSKNTRLAKPPRRNPVSQEVAEEEVCVCANDHPEGGQWICCDSCDKWWHSSCAKLSPKVCAFLIENSESYHCAQCITLELDYSICNTKDNRKLQEDKPTSDSYKESDIQGPSEHIVVIDGIPKPEHYKNSGKILAEIARNKPHCAQNINLAYLLPRGGIAVHCKTTKATEELLQPWKDGAFNAKQDKLASHRTNQTYGRRAILKNIAAEVTQEEIEQNVLEQTGIQVKAHRYHYQDTGKPLRVARVDATQGQLNELFVQSLIIRGVKVTVESYRSKKNTPIRCYNCHRLGHIARLCKEEPSCIRCGGAKGHPNPCKPRCINCGGTHSANDPRCKQFLETRRRLEERLN
ncbi:Hypp2182 [Branchiostoma lanceolatum]|uniref:Hypp2182 protein n=1 Tax=Branchiostoma lanceolatum TaxID=7740 RepID=A0A8K0EM01_BRALA|nr:Hypp2182 [Branchiostoma lanceolatum]